MKLVARCAFGLAVVSGCRAAPMPPIVHHASAAARARDRVAKLPPPTADTPDLTDADLAKLAEEADHMPECELWVTSPAPPPCVLCPAH
jgi:hypothetical protein